ncbi:4'-phosphopantetheinyl transferase superfamily protein [Kitasatospora sp. RB6PN24]|uniref:4'-phosphopantetheinyl transferase family protein n=1 Tax=Kitasatospora humi TaxID=2893891 RepID=UPI001E4D789B|nr:4'-phosphopantetheinyl transferase superfamily protein [Kitasatospora humi]MCC9306321.1 4'-phosphopantetheinyl transferase superfamily protein [Kitasatospora humi]
MGEIEVWRIAVTPANSTAAESLAPRLLDAAEQRKAAAFRRPADQDLYRVAHVALRTLLADRLHRPAADLLFRQAACPGCGEPHGRPEVLCDEPLEFSLSHTTGLALIALAPVTVGLDVEQLAAFGAATATDIARQLHPAEQTELAAVAAELRPAATLRCWVRKEAYLKGTGMGLGAGAGADYVGLGPGYPPTPAGPPPGWTIQAVPVPEDYDAAIALRTDAPGPLDVTVRALTLG